MPERRKLTMHEIFRDAVNVGTLIAVITTAVLIGKWIGANDQKWEGQNEINIDQKATNARLLNSAQELEWWKKACDQREAFNVRAGQ
jgi:hypothetical protein